jgi:hypothetical protein
MADPFTILVMNLNALGFFGFLLPFVFIFVVAYGLLVKSKMFDDQKLVGVLSLVLAFFVIGFGGPGLANFFVNIFGLATLVLAGILIIVLFIALAGGDVSKVMKDNKAVMAVLVGVGIIILFVAAGSVGVAVNDSVIGIIFIVVLLAIAVMFIAK